MIKNQELAGQILGMMDTALEASDQMKDFLKDNRVPEFKEVLEALYFMVKSIQNIADDLKKEEDGINLPEASQSVLVSLARIQKIALQDTILAERKIEFELIPLLEEMRCVFYYWGTVYPDKEKMRKYYKEDMHKLAENRYQAEAARTGVYKYDLSIIVLAYNKLDYTKSCIEGLMKNFPKNLSTEVILFNHGSTDGTKAFFESFHPDKQVDIAVNGGGIGVIYRIAEGKYTMIISNDVIVTPHAIDNLYACIDSNERIAWAVPSTPNISNGQTIPAKYSNLEELDAFAEENNISDARRWEQRVRLCNPIEIIRSSVLHQLKPGQWYQPKNYFAFSDDRFSLLCRRNGYKIYLAKDAYCHHYGSVTVGESDTQDTSLQGRKEFFQVFGIDPWSKGCCYSFFLFESLDCVKEGGVCVLGINCRIGSNSLKIKEELKEKVSNTSVILKNITTEEAFFEDLKGISDEAEYVSDYHIIEGWKETFDYIIAENISYYPESLRSDVELFVQRCKEDGIVILALTDSEAELIKQEQSFLNQYKKVDFVKENSACVWMILYK